MSNKKISTLNSVSVKNITVGHKYDKGQNSIEIDDVNIRSNAVVDGKVAIGKNSAKVSLDVKNVNAIKVPIGTTHQRPPTSSLKPGYIRYNSEEMWYEAWNGISWITISGGISE